MPLIAVEVFDHEQIERLPGFTRRLRWFAQHRLDSERGVALGYSRSRQKLLLSIPTRERLRKVLGYLGHEEEFLSPYGIRSLSRFHEKNPYRLTLDGMEHRVDYAPGESDSALFGGNSNRRGPIWFPVNYLLIEALERYHHFYGPEFTVEYPTGSGRLETLAGIAADLERRLVSLFLPDAAGRRPAMEMIHASPEIPIGATFCCFTNISTPTPDAAVARRIDRLDGAGHPIPPGSVAVPPACFNTPVSLIRDSESRIRKTRGLGFALPREASDWSASMTRSVSPALSRWISQMGNQPRLAEVVIRRRSPGFLLCHHEDVGTSEEHLVVLAPEALREWSQTNGWERSGQTGPHLAFVEDGNPNPRPRGNWRQPWKGSIPGQSQTGMPSNRDSHGHFLSGVCGTPDWNVPESLGTRRPPGRPDRSGGLRNGELPPAAALDRVRPSPTGPVKIGHPLSRTLRPAAGIRPSRAADGEGTGSVRSVARSGDGHPARQP